MASVFLRKKSRFYWIKFRDPDTGKICSKSTGIDVASEEARRKVRRLAAQHTQREMSAPRTSEKERWESWVGEFFAQRYVNPRTAESAKYGLIDLLAFFKERGLRTPRMVGYEDASAFIPWRVSGGLSHNTAILRFNFLRVLMSESVRRGFCESNPCREVEIRREESKVKEEITSEHEAIIIAALAAKPQWMRDQFTVLMRQCCRIAETIVPLSMIDPIARTIRLKLKGGKMHTQGIHRDVLAIYERAKAEGRATLIEPVPSMSAHWCNFFRKLGLPYSPHCTRVTVITRLLRKKVPLVEVISFVGHTEAVNKIYRRLRPSDSWSLLELLDGAPGPSEGTGQPQSQAPAPRLQEHV